MKTGIELIADERKRQVEEEGFTASHDAMLEAGELSQAAAYYANSAGLWIMHAKDLSLDLYPIHVRLMCNPVWPWPSETLKPQSPLRDLVRAGALIAAEIDRLQAQEADHA